MGMVPSTLFVYLLRLIAMSDASINLWSSRQLRDGRHRDMNALSVLRSVPLECKGDDVLAKHSLDFAFAVHVSSEGCMRRPLMGTNEI